MRLTDEQKKAYSQCVAESLEGDEAKQAIVATAYLFDQASWSATPDKLQGSNNKYGFLPLCHAARGDCTRCPALRLWQGNGQSHREGKDTGAIGPRADCLRFRSALLRWHLAGKRANFILRVPAAFDQEDYAEAVLDTIRQARRVFWMLIGLYTDYKRSAW